MQIIDLGMTSIDEDTFDDFIHDKRRIFTAENVRFFVHNIPDLIES